MRKTFAVLLAALLLVVISLQQGAGTWLSTHYSSQGSISAAKLSLSLNDQGTTLDVDLGTIAPGDSGEFVVTMKNTGNISGTLCISSTGDSTPLVVQTTSVCGINVNPGESTQFVIDWSLPSELHGNISSGNVKFSYTFKLADGFTANGQVVIKGEILDYTDIPTDAVVPVETLLPTATPTPAPTDTSTPLETPTVTIAPTESRTVTPSSTATDTPTETEVVPTDTPTSQVTEETVVSTEGSE